ncbi:uncharacterized protein BJ212DRAFT_1304502 [Suillus subaureus]|uniref:Uncharacterized protein n=1 Tax=Suillus subaureus TaxID=48587 RepID=A0A9P7DVL1_9AGAM|nr:uncharacterized protein BJ212DRAFT_1304502 [Suillus subaureus]KAG1803992.1 hypothetical protein BJ212DRAFT_1304502 [Suillus subaureus]
MSVRGRAGCSRIWPCVLNHQERRRLFYYWVILKARLHRMAAEVTPLVETSGKENYERKIWRQRRQLSIWAMESLPKKYESLSSRFHKDAALSDYSGLMDNFPDELFMVHINVIYTAVLLGIFESAQQWSSNFLPTNDLDRKTLDWQASINTYAERTTVQRNKSSPSLAHSPSTHEAKHRQRKLKVIVHLHPQLVQ